MLIALAALALAVTPVDPGPALIGGGHLPSASDLSREEAAAQSSREHGMRGPLPSLYRGEFFHADQEPYRLCVGDREGGFTYMIRGGGGNNYYGTYQMSAALVRGASWMMAAESRRTGDGLRDDARDLLHVPGNKWSRYWQDRAFFTVLNAKGKWSGKSHWAGGRWSC